MDELTRLVDTCVAAAKLHRDSKESGDHRKTNRAHDQVTEAFLKIEPYGDQGIERLSKLLHHDDLGVQGWAAYHLLKTRPETAEPVLERLAEMRGLLGFSAMMTLTEWRKGTLKFPPFG